MTPAEAQTILSLCPPGDETNPDVPGLAAARELAASDSALAAWWEQEKFFDEQFNRKLLSLAPPTELESTILRGGATIFFASRLIAETTGEMPGALPELPDAPSSRPALATPFLDADENKAPTPKAVTWYWRAAVYSAGFVVAIALILLVVALPGILKSKGGKGPELPDFSLYAARLADVPSLPPAPGQTIEDLRKTLDEGHAPNPPGAVILGIIPGGAVPDSVAINSWNVHQISHYVVRAGPNSTHLFILNRAEFPQDDVPQEITNSDLDNYHMQTWSADGFIYIVLKPRPGQP